MMTVSPDIADYFGFGKSKMPAHRSDVTTCPCTRCKKTRGVGDGLKAQSEAIRFILYLKWWRWIVSERRKHWPATHTANPDELEKEEVDEG